MEKYFIYQHYLDKVLESAEEVNLLCASIPWKGVLPYVEYRDTCCSSGSGFQTIQSWTECISIQFWSGFIPVNGGGWIYPTLIAISPMPTLHFAQFKASSFSKPTLLLSFTTCIFHIFFGRHCFLLPFTSNSNFFLQTYMPIIPPIKDRKFCLQQDIKFLNIYKWFNYTGCNNSFQMKIGLTLFWCSWLFSWFTGQNSISLKFIYQNGTVSLNNA